MIQRRRRRKGAPILRTWLAGGVLMLATCGGGAAPVWRCVDIQNPDGPFFCSCDLRPLAEHDSDHTAKICSPALPCCLLWKDKDRCTCDHISTGCEGSARALEATIVDFCPPASGG